MALLSLDPNQIHAKEVNIDLDHDWSFFCINNVAAMCRKPTASARFAGDLRLVARALVLCQQVLALLLCRRLPPYGRVLQLLRRGFGVAC